MLLIAGLALVFIVLLVLPFAVAVFSMRQSREAAHVRKK